jgi:murein L,D-transpeptidase YcbB/YkuD
MSGSRTPWWFGWVVLAIVLAVPSTVAWAATAGINAIHTIADELEQAVDAPSEQQSSDEYVPPCDTQAVLDALGMNVVQYQMDRGLHVDGLVGPQTGAALCAEDLPEGGA